MHAINLHYKFLQNCFLILYAGPLPLIKEKNTLEIKENHIYSNSYFIFEI